MDVLKHNQYARGPSDCHNAFKYNICLCSSSTHIRLIFCDLINILIVFKVLRPESNGQELIQGVDFVLIL